MMKNTREYQEVKLDSLVPYPDHPFEPYEGQRKADMVESIRANGVLVPIIVRSSSDGKYEILSGHNRVAAAKEVGLKIVPAVVRDDLSDGEALLVVTETNLIQRAFADLTHSERAATLATHYEAMKMKSGYRSDLIQDIESMTSSPVGPRSTTRDKLGAQHGLSKNTITRYLCVNKLIPELKSRLNKDGIAMRAAVSLSFLSAEEQELVDFLLMDDRKISMKQAEMLRLEAKKGKLNKKAIKDIYESGASKKVKPMKFSGQFVSKVSGYFTDGQTPEEIESEVAKALEQYFASKS